jgi:hypothetical protein
MGTSRPGPRRRPSIYSPQLARVMSQEEMTLFEWVFEDAYLVDVDLASWRTLIALYLAAPHAAERYQGDDAPLFIAEFHRVRSWHLEFNHLAIDASAPPAPAEPVVWRIDHYAVQPVAGGLEFAFWGGGDDPRLTLICERLVLRVLPRRTLDRLAPDWDGSFTRFIRRGPDDAAREGERRPSGLPPARG